jgi:hypothetical protein
MSPQPWWEIFVGSGKTMALVTAANAILGLCNMTRTETASGDSLVASRGFVKSLIKDGGSFNDPGSFLWEHQTEALEQKAAA